MFIGYAFEWNKCFTDIADAFRESVEYSIASSQTLLGAIRNHADVTTTTVHAACR